MLQRKRIKKIQALKKQTQRELQRAAREKDIRERMKRVNSEEFKAFRKEQYVKAHAHLQELEVIEPRPGWMNGIGAKRSMLDPVRLDRIDSEEVNQKRREAGIYIPIEVAADDAQQEALAKSKNIGISYNKGGYVYLGTGKDVKDLGKKTSQVE